MLPVGAALSYGFRLRTRLCTREQACVFHTTAAVMLLLTCAMTHPSLLPQPLTHLLQLAQCLPHQVLPVVLWLAGGVDACKQVGQVVSSCMRQGCVDTQSSTSASSPLKPASTACSTRTAVRSFFQAVP